MAKAKLATDVTVEVSVDPGSVDTGIAMRDRSLRSSYLETKLFPAATFTAAGVTHGAGGETIDGTLELHGVKKPVTLQIESTGEANLPLVARKHVVATTKLSRDAFGIHGAGSFLTMADEVLLRIEIDNPAAAK